MRRNLGQMKPGTASTGDFSASTRDFSLVWCLCHNSPQSISRPLRDVVCWVRDKQRTFPRRPATSPFGTRCMVRSSLQMDFAELAVSGLASMYPAFDWSVWCSGPSWITRLVHHLRKLPHHLFERLQNARD